MHLTLYYHPNVTSVFSIDVAGRRFDEPTVIYENRDCSLGARLIACQGHSVLCRTPERHSTRKLWKETVMTDEEQQEMPKAGLLMQAAEDGAYGC
jgi:hypothetical protein